MLNLEEGKTNGINKSEDLKPKPILIASKQTNHLI